MPSSNIGGPYGKDSEMDKIDAHQHFWRVADQDQPWRTSHHDAIARDFTPDQLALEASDVGVTRTVLVQSVDEPAENDRLASFSEHPIVAGVVAWAPLAEPERAREELSRLRIDKLCGVRCLIGKDPLPWLEDDGVVALLAELAERDIAWDVVPVTSEQIAAVLKVARALPQLRIIIDHLGRPPVETEGWEPWAGYLGELANCQNVAVKLSIGLDLLTVWPQWRLDELMPYVGWAGEQFGPDRIMLANNWPVVTLKASYAQAWTDLEQAASHLFIGPKLDRVVAGTAQEWYGLNPEESQPELGRSAAADAASSSERSHQHDGRK